MLWAPDESVMVTDAPGRSRMTVSLLPGRLGVGIVRVPTRGTCPGPWTGAIGLSPLFQLVRVVHCPEAFVIQSAGTHRSLSNSIPPWATSTSQLAAPPPMALTCAVLAYCHKFHGWDGFG